MKLPKDIRKKARGLLTTHIFAKVGLPRVLELPEKTMITIEGEIVQVSSVYITRKMSRIETLKKHYEFKCHY